MNQLVEILPKMSKFNNLITDIKSGMYEDIFVNGLTDSQKMHMIFGISNYTEKNVLIITYSEMQAKKLVKDLEFYMDNDIDIVYFPKREIRYFTAEAINKDTEKQRIQAIEKIINKGSTIVVSTLEAVMQKLMPYETYIDNNIILEVGQGIEIENIVEKFIKSGYERTDIVEGAGQFAVRGGIVDIFPLNYDLAIRIEMFGDEIDSIRAFNADTQRTIDTLHKVKISVAKEFLVLDNLEESIKKLEEREYTDKLKEVVEADIELMKNGDSDNIIDKYFSLIYSVSDNLLGYIDKMGKYIVCLDEPNRISDKAEAIENENKEVLKNSIERESVIGEYATPIYSYEYIEEQLKTNTLVNFEKLRIGRILHAKRKEYSFNCREVNFFRGTMDIFIQEIQKALVSGKSVVLLYRTMQAVEAVYKQLKDNNIQSYIIDLNNKELYDLTKNLNKSQVYITCGSLSSGFEYFDEDEVNIYVVTEEREGNARGIRRNISKGKFTNAQKVLLEDLKVGDFVVHTNHGIGKYIGIKTIETEGIKKDYITIEYAKGGVLYVPTNQMDSVMKYLGDTDNAPKLNSLSSKEWDKTKNKAKKSLENIAKELITLYSIRQNTQGYAFSQDTVWQKEFEDQFEYTETDDQLNCIEEVKRDMERSVPMDRLLCGDVGYGKTEVAIRAAFKAVMDQKQVAYLVPTTVLAMQQFESFKERMKDFPVKVEVLCRFRTKKEQDKIIKQLRTGEIDILIGTHRIIQDDVIYKDLGLLIIDEEQRFGVKQKEKIKGFKNNIDVLAMSATPIPRTMHMSIVGIRDMSTIYEPPRERIPVQTYVLEYDDDTIKQALERELDRDGQVIYIYNRVDGIERVASHVSSLVPEARVAYAHGQMSSKELEDIMYSFMNHDIDIIVCTTILESGIDVQNANTLIIENSDHMGLSQLYQIRGRVGRSNRIAHAYITYKKDKVISEIAEKRLKAIKEFTEFGSGFKIALRDLEIRGAGNILGSEQHGHMEAVGYDMYCRLLDEAIRKLGKDNEHIQEKLNNSSQTDDFEVKIDIDVSAYIPDTYIQNSEQKIAMYQRISYIYDEESRDDVIDELQDRYGDIPEATMNLIKIMEIKLLARKLKIKHIKQKGNRITLEPFAVFSLTNSSKNDILFGIKDMLETIEKEGSKKE